MHKIILGFVTAAILLVAQGINANPVAIPYGQNGDVPVVFDENGDRKPDLAVWRPSDGCWYVIYRNCNSWGDQKTDKPMRFDIDGDGRSEYAIWRPTDGKWWIKDKVVEQWGTQGDIPLEFDFEGDGRSDFAVWRPTDGNWYIKNKATIHWGQQGDIPVRFDIDGDRKTDPTVFRPSTGQWFVLNKGTFSYGTAGDIPLTFDYNGDGKNDLAIWRPSNGTWAINTNQGIKSVQWGQQGDIPLSMDYDGNGTTDYVVWRPSDGKWYILLNDAQSAGGAGSAGGGTQVSGSIDPIAELVKAVPQVSTLFSPFKGVLSLDSAEGPALENNQVFAVKGSFHKSKIGGTSLMAKMLQAVVGVSMGVFGVQDTMTMEVSLVQANAEWDLALAISIIDTFQVTPALVPGIEPRLAFKDAQMILHLKFPLGAPSYSQELTGTFFYKPTKFDPWLALQPTVEIDNEGSVTVGGSLSGACGNFNQSTSPEQCTGIWDVLGLHLVQSQGGVLKLTLDPKAAPVAITGIEAAIQNARFVGPGGAMAVDGAVLMDVDTSPGVGVALTSKQNSNPAQFLSLMPFANVEPFKSLQTAMNGAASSGLLPSGATRIIIAPTGLNVGHINYNGPTFAFGGDFNGPYMTNTMDAKLSGDIGALIRGDFAKAVDASFKMGIGFANINANVKKAVDATYILRPLSGQIMNGFRLDNASVEVYPKSGTGKAGIDFTVVGQRVHGNLPLDAIFRPDRVVPYIVKKIEHLMGDLGKIVLQGLETAGKEIAKGATVVGEGIVDGVNAVGGVFEDLGGQVGNALKGIFGSSPNNWDKTKAAYPWQILNIEWFQQMHRPQDSDLWRNIYHFHNPFIKQHLHGWTPWFDPDYYLDNNPDIVAAAKGHEARLNDLVWNGTGGVYSWKRPGGHNAAIDDSYFTNNTASGSIDNLPTHVAPRRGNYQAFQRYFAFEHYMGAGMNEKRVANYYLNPKYYAYKYPDVAKAYRGKSVTELFVHYMEHGRHEGRQGHPVKPAGAAGIASNAAHLPCRALVDNKLLVGTWHHGARRVQCEIAYGPTTQKFPIFDVLIGDDTQWVPMTGTNYQLRPDYSIPVSAYNADGSGREVCAARDQGAFRYGYVDNGVCWIGSHDTTRSVQGQEASRIYVKNAQWVIP